MRLAIWAILGIIAGIVIAVFFGLDNLAFFVLGNVMTLMIVHLENKHKVIITTLPVYDSSRLPDSGEISVMGSSGVRQRVKFDKEKKS